MNMAKQRPFTDLRLRWKQDLRFRLAVLFAAVFLVLAGSAWWISSVLARNALAQDTFRYQRESGQRLAAQLSLVSQHAESLAASLVSLAERNLDSQTLPTTALGFMEHQNTGAQIVGFGVWPEPHAHHPQVERASLYWQRESGDSWRLRLDYNDPRVSPYYREKWYTPARYVQTDRCYWTPAYREPLTQRNIVTCAMPIRSAGKFLGIVTMELSVEGLATSFTEAVSNDTGYSILVDRNSHLLALSPRIAEPVGKLTAPPARNLADLAKRHPAFSPVAITLRQRELQALAISGRFSSYDETAVSALKSTTREMSREEAASALASLTSRSSPQADLVQSQEPLLLDTDSVLSEPASAYWIEMPGTTWRLIQVVPVLHGFTSAEDLHTQTVILILGAIMLAFAFAFAALYTLVITPLRNGNLQFLTAGANGPAHSNIGILARTQNGRTDAPHAFTEAEADEQYNVQEALTHLQEQIRLTLWAVRDGIIVTDNLGRVEDMNPAAEALTGVSLQRARGRPLPEVFRVELGASAGEPPNVALLCMEHGTPLDSGDAVDLLSAAEGKRSITFTATPVHPTGQNTTSVLLMFRETSEAQKPHAIEHRGTDSLTGLRSRAVCERCLRQLVEQSRLLHERHTLLYLDLDHFRRLQDEIGSTGASDSMLIQLGQTLAARVGDVGEVFRLYSDRYAVVLPNFGLDRAHTFAEALREAVAQTTYHGKSREFRFTVSIGIADFDGGAETPAQILHRGETACYAAKRNGRNQVKAFDETLEAARLDKDDKVAIQRIRRGLDEGLFRLTTQWILPSQPYATEGNVYEILLTLEDEQGSRLPPAAFMPAAERHNLVQEVDRWVVSQTLQQLARQPAVLERMAFCSINISAASLGDRGISDYIERAFKQYPVPPNKICFELGEQILYREAQQAQAFAEAIRTLGCRLSVDHFVGRRLGDFAVLKRMPVEYVKLDALSFKQIASDPVEQVLTESAIRIVRMLRKRVIAVGIEDNLLLDAWRKQGADYFQGYAVAKPTPALFQERG